MVPSITAASLLDALPSGADPFAFLSHRLEGELFTKTPPQIRKGMYALSALMGLTLLVNIVGLVLKVSRGDRWLYKRQERPQGTLLLPNTVLNFMIYNVIYLVIAFPFALLPLHAKDHLFNAPLWMGFTFLPLFFGIWHCTWGTSVSATLQASRSNSRLQLPPIILNSFFVAGLVTAPIALIATTALRTVSWNRGVSAFRELDAALKVWVSLGGSADTVVDVIPNCDALLHTMTVNFYRWSPPWEVCAAFAMLSGLVMAVACWIQTRILRRQINQVWESSIASDNNTSGLASEASMPRTLVDRAPLNHDRVVVFRTVIAVSVTLCISMFAYFCVCFLGNLYVAATPIFKISKSRSTHSYIILFGYTVIDAVVVSIILYQTLTSPSQYLSTSSRQSASLPSKYSQGDNTLLGKSRESYLELDHFTATPRMSKIPRVPAPNEKSWPPSPGSPGWLPEYPGTPVEAHLRQDSPTQD